jgi:hypothetical protein
VSAAAGEVSVSVAGEKEREGGGGYTLPRHVALNEPLGRTRLLKLGRQPRQLRQLLIDYPDLGRQLLLVDVAREEATDEACVGEAMLERGWWTCRRGGTDRGLR